MIKQSFFKHTFALLMIPALCIYSSQKRESFTLFEVREKIAEAKKRVQTNGTSQEVARCVLGPILTYDSLTETNANRKAFHLQNKGELARYTGEYKDAIEKFTSAIAISPGEPTPYLRRSAAYFDLGDYDKSRQDFRLFADQAEKAPFSQPYFVAGFAKGIPQGAYESGQGVLFFLADLVTTPVHAARQMFNALETLARNSDKAFIEKVTCAELYQLIADWDAHSSMRRGELAGYALGKYGSSITAPDAFAKVTEQGKTNERKLTLAFKNLQTVATTLILEIAAEAGLEGKEAIETGSKVGFQTNAPLAKEVVPTPKEVAPIPKEVAPTQKEVASPKKEIILPKKEAPQPPQVVETKTPKLSRKDAIQQYRNAQKALKAHRGKAMPEDQARKLIQQAGLPTFPRPQGIPQDFWVSISIRGGGIVYHHPKNSHTMVKVMPGKPQSRWLQEREPHIVYTRNGNFLDKSGNAVAKESENVFIPLAEFNYY